MPICNQCKKRNKCRKACKELKKELSQVTTHRNRREKNFEPKLLDNKLVDSNRGFYKWTDKEELKKKRPKTAGMYIRRTFIERTYSKVYKKHHPCYVYENKNGKKGKLKRKL